MTNLGKLTESVQELTISFTKLVMNIEQQGKDLTIMVHTLERHEEMIERIEVTKQPSVAQGSVASSAVINIILKEPLDTRINGSVKIGYGLRESEHFRKSLGSARRTSEVG